MPGSWTRRQFFENLFAPILATALPGCASGISKDKLCSPDIRRSDPTKSLTIDVHAHFFNGSDVQIGGLLRDVLAKDNPEVEDILKRFAETLQHFVWRLVPGPTREKRALARLRMALSKCGAKDLATADNGTELTGVVRSLRQEAYRDSLDQLMAANRKARITDKSFASDDVADLLATLPDDAEEFFFEKGGTRTMMVNGDLQDPKGVVSFVLRMSQYRCVNYIDYLATIGTSKSREIDLVVAHILDFDVPLGKNRPTETSIPEQIAMMEELSILSGGRVHCFAPFDPMKAVLSRARPTPLDIVKNAVERHGFIGVKLYPPMGFRAYGNAALPNDFWRRSWLPPEIQAVADFGKRIDAELLKLYTWCRERGVPIMAHTHMSMGVTDDFQAMVGAEYWKLAIDEVPGLRINFGHFGNTRLVENGISRNRRFMRLMTSGQGSKGQHLYADSGYFAELLSDRAKLETALRELNREFISHHPPIFDRLMFGTDWTMTSILGDKVNAYLADFEQVLSDLEGPSFGAGDSNRFFGQNAAEFLGLAADEKNRNRLMRFYAGSPSIGTPSWVNKVDKLSG